MSRREFGRTALGAAAGLLASKEDVRVPPKRPGVQHANTIIDAAVRQGEIPGAVLQVRADGTVMHEQAFGRRQFDRDVLLQCDDVFPVASLTKPIVAAGVLQLCEAGAVRLDDVLARYLPEFRDPRVLLQYELRDGSMVTRPARRPITIRQLLTHTAGIHDGFVTSNRVMGTLYERAGVVYDLRLLLADKVRRLGPLPLAHDPGKAWTYGLSSDVAGRLIEVVSGQSLDRFLSRGIFEPLNMRETYFFVPPVARARLVARHIRRASGETSLMLLDSAKDSDERYLSGGGGLHCTVADYGRFVQALLDGGRPILSTASLDAMTRNHIGDLTAFGFAYGLSIGVATSKAPGRVPLPIGGFGWYGIYSTWFWTLPRRRAAIVFFSNIMDAEMNLPLFSRIVRAVEGAL